LRIDANVILRHLVGDAPDHATRANRLFGAVAAGVLQVTIDEIVLGEVVWTLSRHCKVDRARIAELLLTLLGEAGILNPDKPALQMAMAFYGSLDIDFADAVVAAKTLAEGESEVYTFDRDFDRIPGIIRREP
jgi:uncharacterized protein